MGVPSKEFEAIPSWEWSVLEFAFDRYEHEYTGDLISAGSRIRWWADVVFNKDALMGVPETWRRARRPDVRLFGAPAAAT